MALGDGSTWDESLPTDATLATLIDDHILDVRKGIRSRMALEHEWPASQASTAVAGQHKFITLQNQATQPTLSGTQVSALYIKTDGGTAYGLYFAAKSGNEKLIAGTGGANLPTGACIAMTRYAIASITVGSNLTPCVLTSTYNKTMGDEYFTFVYTPQGSGNTVLISSEFNGAPEASDVLAVALFKDTDSNALRVAMGGAGAVGYPETIKFDYSHVVTGTTAITYKIRASQPSTGYKISMNGMSNNGGVFFSTAFESGFTIREFKG